jgi:tetraacyldisaccharide 4'-kinase
MNRMSPYAAVARARRARFEHYPARRRHLRRPVVSVGNLTVGGSGKTPAVAHIANLLLSMGERPAILTRGYRRPEPSDGVVVVSDGERIRADYPRAGDEPLMLAKALPGVAVFACPDRYLAGTLAERRFERSVHLLDDGFQHVRLHRDLDLVLLSASDLDDDLLPLGRLRESPEVAARADALIVYADDEAAARALADRVGVATVFRVVARIGRPRAAQNPTVAAQTPTVAAQDFSPVNHRVLAVAGIARPRRFFDGLAAAGWDVAKEIAFRDHHRFTRADVDRLAREARDASATLVLTTEKDLVRLLPYRPFPIEIAAVPLEFSIEPHLPFREWLQTRLAAVRASTVP